MDGKIFSKINNYEIIPSAKLEEMIQEQQTLRHNRSFITQHLFKANGLISEKIIDFPITEILQFNSHTFIPPQGKFPCLFYPFCEDLFDSIEDCIKHTYLEPTHNIEGIEQFKRFLPYELTFYISLFKNFQYQIPNLINEILPFQICTEDNGFVFRRCPLPLCNYLIKDPEDFRIHFIDHLNHSKELCQSFEINGFIWSIIICHVKVLNKIPTLREFLGIPFTNNLITINPLNNVNSSIPLIILLRNIDYNFENSPPWIALYHNNTILQTPLRFIDGGIIINNNQLDLISNIQEIPLNNDNKIKEITDNEDLLNIEISSTIPIIEEVRDEIILKDQHINEIREKLYNFIQQIIEANINNNNNIINKNINIPNININVEDKEINIPNINTNINQIQIEVPNISINKNEIPIFLPETKVMLYDQEIQIPKFGLSQMEIPLEIPNYQLISRNIEYPIDVPHFNTKEVNFELNIPNYQLMKKDIQVPIETPKFTINEKRLDLDIMKFDFKDKRIPVEIPMFDLTPKLVDIEIPIPIPNFNFNQNQLSLINQNNNINENQISNNNNINTNNINNNNENPNQNHLNNNFNNENQNPNNNQINIIDREELHKPNELINDLRNVNSDKDLTEVINKWSNLNINNIEDWIDNNKPLEEHFITNLMVINKIWPGVNTFVCPYACGFATHSNTTLNIHQNEVHRKVLKGNPILEITASIIKRKSFWKIIVKNNDNNISKNYRETLWSCPCPNCKYVGDNKSTFASHIRKNHPLYNKEKNIYGWFWGSILQWIKDPIINNPPTFKKIF